MREGFQCAGQTIVNVKFFSPDEPTPPTATTFIFLHGPVTKDEGAQLAHNITEK
jgi:hypothetical protein